MLELVLRQNGKEIAALEIGDGLLAEAQTAFTVSQAGAGPALLDHAQTAILFRLRAAAEAEAEQAGQLAAAPVKEQRLARFADNLVRERDKGDDVGRLPPLP